MRVHWGDENIPAIIFNHTALFFLHGFMVFENNFTQFNTDDSSSITSAGLSEAGFDLGNEEEMKSSRASINEMDRTVKEIFYVEDDFSKMDSRAYII